MMNRWILVFSSITFLSACGPNSNHANQEVTPEGSVIVPSDSNTQSDVPTYTPPVAASTLDKAYNAFLNKGVPQIPLQRAFNFFKANRASVGGLKDSSCLIEPMSESGAIAHNDNRYDPTTLNILREGIRNERYIVIIDYTQSNKANRGYILDLEPTASGDFNLTQVSIANGYGSQADSNGVPQKFTNAANQGTTLSGFFLTGQVTYNYVGHALSTGTYYSTGLRLYGLESTNNTAEETSKVAHGAPYVTDSKGATGNSAGCAAMSKSNSAKVLPSLKGGILWYHHTKINNTVAYKAPSCAH